MADEPTVPTEQLPWPSNAKIQSQFAAGPGIVKWVKIDLPEGQTGLIMVVMTPSATVATFWDEKSGRAMLEKGLSYLGPGIQRASLEDVGKLFGPNGQRPL